MLADSSTWKLSSFNASGRALRSQVVKVDSDGTASFTFPTTTNAGLTADAAYLTTSKVGTVGDLTGEELSATVGIDAPDGTGFFNYPGCNNTTSNPTVGLYFQTSAPGGFNPSDYWWASDRRLVAGLVDLPTLLTQPLDLGYWSDWDGHMNNYDAAHEAAFAIAVANVTSWGVSFGGDCFYANGVGASNGSAIFWLTPTP